MKKILLGTTALVAAGAFVGAAQADEMMAEPISVGVGGYYHSALIVTASDDDTDRGHGLQQDIEIQVAGSTTLDNGITVSVRARLEGDKLPRVGPATSARDRGQSQRRVRPHCLRHRRGSRAERDALGAGRKRHRWRQVRLVRHQRLRLDDGRHERGQPQALLLLAGLQRHQLRRELRARGHGRLPARAAQQRRDTYGEGIQSAINYSVDVMGGSFAANVGYETYASEDTGGENATASRFGATLSIDQISIGGAVQTRSDTG